MRSEGFGGTPKRLSPHLFGCDQWLHSGGNKVVTESNFAPVIADPAIAAPTQYLASYPDSLDCSPQSILHDKVSRHLPTVACRMPPLSKNANATQCRTNVLGVASNSAYVNGSPQVTLVETLNPMTPSPSAKSDRTCVSSVSNAVTFSLPICSFDRLCLE